MNSDDSHPDMQNPITPELEARVLAWLSGEASAAEAAELERLVSSSRELAALRDRLTRGIELARQAVSADREPLRLSADRRTKLLQDLSIPAESPASERPSLVALRRRQRNERQVMLAVAACLTCGLFLSGVIYFSGTSIHTGVSAKSETLYEREEPDATGRDARIVRDRKAEALGKFKKEKLASEDLARSVAVALPSSESDAEPAVAGGPPAESGSSAPLALQAPAAGKEGAQSDGAALAFVSPALDGPVSDALAANSVSGAGAPGPIEKSGVSAPDPAPKTLPSPLPAGRIRADLAGVSSAVTVVTAQFLSDPREAARASGGASANAQASYNKPGKASADIPEAAAVEESNASKEALSTFSLHVSDVSFRLAQAALARGEMPDPARIRAEEFYNAFSYGDPEPSMAEKISCRTEQAADPVAQQRNLVRIAMRVPATGHGAAQPLRLTVLLDTSGSMEREDRAAAVHSAMAVLVSLLGRNDRLSVVGFARQPHLLADQVPGDRAASVLDIIAHTPPEGGTNLEEAIKLGGELAHRQWDESAQNRIVLMTDGAANLGDANPAHLAAAVEALRQQGIAFDACGVGTDGIDDTVLEALTRKGAGRYYVLNTPEAADAGFARQLAGAFRPAAENVKVQVRFNPARVGNYRLIGFEQHRLNAEDFHDDKVQAAELAAGEAAVALYEVEVLPQGEGELGEVHVRFHDLATGGMVERSWALAYEPGAPSFDRATPTLQLAGTAALLAEKLRGGARGESIRLETLAPVVAALRTHYAHDARVQQLVAMYEQMSRVHRD